MSPTENVEPQFRLTIEMTGICLYVWDAETKAVTVFMPDARCNQDDYPRHPDGTPAVPHAGYLRFDLRDVETGVTYGGGGGSDLSPSYEVVHRFQHEELVLDLPDGEPISLSLRLPDFGTFAPVLRTNPALYDREPPPCVLMRTRLVGGDIFTVGNAVRADSLQILWKIDGDLHPEGKQTVGPFEGEVVWERTLNGTGLTLLLSRFDGTGTVTIPLVARPVEGGTPEIRLKLANLCENPLEWEELEMLPQPVTDVDFKWLYRLLERRPDVPEANYPDHLCPVPEPILRPNGNEGDLQDCFGALGPPR